MGNAVSDQAGGVPPQEQEIVLVRVVSELVVSPRGPGLRSGGGALLLRILHDRARHGGRPSHYDHIPRPQP